MSFQTHSSAARKQQQNFKDEESKKHLELVTQHKQVSILCKLFFIQQLKNNSEPTDNLKVENKLWKLIFNEITYMNCWFKYAKPHYARYSRRMWQAGSQLHR